MKCALALALLFWQAAGVPTDEDTTSHLRWERALTVPAGAAGQTCAVLDAEVYAGAEGESLNDVRLYAASPGIAGVRETPFALTESNTDHADSEPATVRNLRHEGTAVVFDLAMPPRPYTAVELSLDAKNFVGSATVSGRTANGHAVALGEFAVFDLTAEHLSRVTTLPLQESTFPELHVRLQLRPSPGSPVHAFPSSLVTGASVPPSRSAQMLYTAVAGTSAWAQRGPDSVATLQLPPHVPVARVEAAMDPAYRANFLREVTVTARPLNSNAADPQGSDVESVQGEISQVRLNPVQSGPGGVAIDNRQMSVDAVLAANLRGPATVEVSVGNGGDPPLPLRSVSLAMRQRRICFDLSPAAQPGVYTLMYGDKEIAAPVYDYARVFIPSISAAKATLGPERPNPAFRARTDVRPMTERQPELLWFALLAALASLGGVALRGMRQQRGASH